jgi:hypothetical protein
VLAFWSYAERCLKRYSLRAVDRLIKLERIGDDRFTLAAAMLTMPMERALSTIR